MSRADVPQAEALEEAERHAELARRIEAFRASYEELLGFVPPRVAARFDSLADTDPELLVAQEHLRSLAMYPDCLDQKSAQLILFGMLMSKLSDAAKLHGVAARRAGATEQQLKATVNLAALFGGVSVANRAPAVLDEINQLMQRSTR